MTKLVLCVRDDICTARVLAGCQSLVELDGSAAGKLNFILHNSTMYLHQ
jgi:hypothetical protein